MANSEWYGDGLEFTCTQCGNCCTGEPGYVLFTSEEERQMAEYKGVSIEEFRKLYTHRVGRYRSLSEQWNPDIRGYDCVFLDRDESGKALCSVYPVRPTQCRTWPFWPENLRRRRDWNDAAQKCPGMNQGKHYPVEEIRIIRDRNA